MSQSQVPQQQTIFPEKLLNSGRSQVILVKSSTTNQQYAMKVFNNDEHSQSAFNKEKRMLSQLNHPNIIKFVPEHLFQNDFAQYNVLFMEFARYGDFFSLILDNDFSDQKLIRTYFHQLIKGLKYLHSKNIAHLDLKLENLLMGSDFQLKVADFDMAQKNIDQEKVSGGTANYRAPEVKARTCKNFFAADIYSIGICLYTLMTGAFPFMEEDNENSTLFRYDTYQKHNEQFWSENEALLAGKVNFSQNLKDLLNQLWCEDPSERLTLEQITESRWFNEPVYSEEELNVEIRKILPL